MQVHDIIAQRFHLAAVAGTGAMGTVFRARDLRTGADVAVKVLHLSDPKMAERFAREAEILLQLDHPAIVRFVASGATEQGERYLAMEWLEGEDLGVRIGPRDGLSVAETIAMVRRVASALGVAHERGIVHRDIKPSNLFLPGGNPAEVKVLDFGIARLTDLDRKMTATGATLGTPAYMSPEQAQGQGNLDARVDVFALGSVLFECLAGLPAYPGDTLMEILGRILFGEPPRLRDVRPDLPPQLDEVLHRMMAKDPADRYRDGAEVAAALGALQSVQGSRPKSAAFGAITLTGAEQRFVAIVVVGGTRHLTQIDATLEIGDHRAGLDTIRTSARMFGFRLEEMPDGTVVAILDAPGLPTEQLERAARFSLRLREQVGDAPIALASGWGVVEGRATLSAVVDRALHTLRQGTADGVVLDDATAALLDARFDVQRGGGTLMLARERGSADALRMVLGKPTQCVGRVQELALLEATFTQCADEGEARAVLVTAPPGMGKSRVAFEFLHRLQQTEADFHLLQGRGDPMSAGSPYGLLAPAIRRSAGMLDGEPQPVLLRKLRERVAQSVPEENRRFVTDFLGELVAVRNEADDPALRAARADPSLMAAQTGKALIDFLTAECRRQPVVLVLEDLHWGDLPSVRAVDAVLRELRDEPLLVLALGRPELHQRFPSLWREREVTRLELGRLPHKSCEKLVQQVLGKDVAPALLAEMLERCEGNPFCLEELMRHVAQGGGDGFPDSVLGMVQARLDALDVPTRRVLRAASVFGATSWLGGVAAMLGGLAQTMATHDCLETLVRAELLRRQPTAVFPDETEYVFPSAMVRDAAYATLTGADRAVGHLLAAEWLELRGAPNPVVLAQHYERGGRLDTAAGWYLQAAAQALDGNDMDTVLARCDQGLRCGATGEVRGRMRLLQAEVHEWKGAWAESEAAAEEAMALLAEDAAEQGGPGHGAPSAARRAAWFHAAGTLLLARGRFGWSEPIDDLVQALCATPPTDDAARGRKVIALCRGALTLLWLGRYDLAAAQIGEAEQAAAPLAGLHLLASARLHHARAYRALFLGETGRAIPDFAAAAEAWRQAGDQRSTAGVSTNLGFTLALAGQYARAEAVLRVQLASAERMGLGFLQAVVEHNLGTVLALSGRLAEGVAIKEAAVARMGRSGQPRVDGNMHAALADVLLLAGRTAEAADHAQQAVALLGDFPPTHAYALGVLARARLDQGQVDAALAAAEHGMALLDRLGGIEEGESLLRLTHAEALAAVGRDAEAHAAAAAAAARLRARAASFADPADRLCFLTGVAVHARTLEVARERAA